jgi:hypothetical protein
MRTSSSLNILFAKHSKRGLEYRGFYIMHYHRFVASGDLVGEWQADCYGCPTFYSTDLNELKKAINKYLAQ